MASPFVVAWIRKHELPGHEHATPADLAVSFSAPAWLGWPGGPPPPGSGWVPGPVLRTAILGLACAFLALALTVNSAASVTFFLLAILGMYVGFRRGFVAGLSRAEKLVMLAFVAYPAVAIASYMLGTQTNVGFRMLGRDLRFLLFIPTYLAIRWSRPQARHIGWALAGGAVGALIIALLQRQPWPAPVPHGVAGTHISFGDLSILSGFLAAALLAPFVNEQTGNKLQRWAGWGGAAVGLLTGVATGVIAGARGGWVAIPVLLLVFLWLTPASGSFRSVYRLCISIIGIALLAAAGWWVPSVHHQIHRARRSLEAYLTVANVSAVNAPCVDRKTFLSMLMDYSVVLGPGKVHVARLPEADRNVVHGLGCNGGYALHLVHGGSGNRPLQLKLYRGNAPASRRRQAATILARGQALFTVGWRGPWVRIKSTNIWRSYRAVQSYRLIRALEVHVPAHGNLWLIPRQIPHGFFAYALARSSVGYRLEMWRAAWILFLRHPWIGAGTGAFRALSESALGASAMAPIVGAYDHAHSDYLTSLSTKGICGLLAFIALIVAPLIALTRLRNKRKLWLAGTTLMAGFAVFALTETIFVHSLVISWYVVAGAALVAAGSTAWAPSIKGRTHGIGLG
jgi:hypothetical protein